MGTAAPVEEVATELLLLKAGKIGSSLCSRTDECANLELPDRGVRGRPPLKIGSRTHDKWRAYSIPVSFEDSFPPQSTDDFTGEEDYAEDSSEDPMPKTLTKEELQALLADSERQKLVEKLSEANQQNRFLKRQLHVKEDALVNFKKELAVMELELQGNLGETLALLPAQWLMINLLHKALVSLAEEIAKSGIPQGTRKVNGKYIQSHLLSRLEAIQEKLKEQIKDVEAAESKEVPLFWCGMAESVQVMGTFDGWIQGEHLSSEYMGSYTKFSTTLMLPPGRYEIKFLVDGEWTLSPEYPTVGEGLMKNNLLVVE